MPILTKPATVEKNVAASFSLSRSALAALAPVAADPYFSDVTNWSRVILFYETASGDQKEIVAFNPATLISTADFLVSDKARDEFLIKRIIIKDFDNGSFEVQRSQLTPAEFDVTLSAGGGGGPLTWTSDISPAAYTATATSIEKLSGGGWDFNVVTDQTLSGDMYIEARVAAYPNNMIIGFQNTSANSSSVGSVLGAISYGLYCDPGTGLNLFWKTSAGYSFNSISTVALNDTIKIVIEGGAGGTVKSYKNGSLVNTTNVSSMASVLVPYSEPYRIGVALNETGSKFDNIVFDNV